MKNYATWTTNVRSELHKKLHPPMSYLKGNYSLIFI